MKWPTELLGSLCDVISGGTPKRTVDEYWNGEIPWVKISDMLQGEIKYTDESITAKGLRESPARLLEPGTLLLSIFATVGRTAVLAIPAATNQAIVGLRIKTENLDQRYLRHYLDSQAEALKSKSRGVAQDNINTSILKSLEIPLPPLEEQRRIAAILDKAASLEADQQRRTELLWRIEASLFCQMSEKTACESKKCTLRDLTEDGDKINYGVVQPGNQVNSGIPLIRVGDLVGGGVDRSALKCIDPEIESAYARSRIKGNELLLSCVGSIGTVAEVGPADIGSNIARAVARIPVSETVNRKWLAACLRSSTIQRYFTNELRTVSQPTLNIKQIEETEINLPPIELQNTFASKLHAVERVYKRSSFSEAQTRQLISALQSRAFFGLLQLQ